MQQGRQGYRRQHQEGNLRLPVAGSVEVTARELCGRYSKFTFNELPLRVIKLKPSGTVGAPAGLLHTESILSLHYCQR